MKTPSLNQRAKEKAMIEFLGWLVVFSTVFGIAVNKPLLGFIIAVVVAIGFNPWFWIIPIVMVIAFILAWYSLRSQY